MHRTGHDVIQLGPMFNGEQQQADMMIMMNRHPVYLHFVKLLECMAYFLDAHIFFLLDDLLIS